ncbi:hypothetical protein SASPL_101728 [Salvia splendens]|uniref:Uncharacterized protein n=1 Tax=Salvia splendens TaxID=180675 RepID=A0A8X9ADJ9_SALSN|nr:hypothetical protein SASPL_101728 [Salvia splendens]
MTRQRSFLRWIDIWAGRCEVFGAVRRRIRRRSNTEALYFQRSLSPILHRALFIIFAPVTVVPVLLSKQGRV